VSTGGAAQDCRSPTPCRNEGGTRRHRRPAHASGVDEHQMAVRRHTQPRPRARSGRAGREIFPSHEPTHEPWRTGQREEADLFRRATDASPSSCLATEDDRARVTARRRREGHRLQSRRTRCLRNGLVRRSWLGEGGFLAPGGGGTEGTGSWLRRPKTAIFSQPLTPCAVESCVVGSARIDGKGRDRAYWRAYVLTIHPRRSSRYSSPAHTDVPDESGNLVLQAPSARGM